MNVRELKKQLENVDDNLEVTLQIQNIQELFEDDDMGDYCTVYGYDTSVQAQNVDEHEFDLTKRIYIIGKVLDDK